MADISFSIEPLRVGPLHTFRDWRTAGIPTHGAGVYSIWDQDLLVYVGMSGRSITRETPRRKAPNGMYTRIDSHASGRRSGDQFCVYVADRLVLPTLDIAQLKAIAAGTVSLDRLTREYIHSRLAFRYVMVPDGAAARALENRARCGELGQPPLLNPKG